MIDKDVAIDFLETVTYDEMMAWDYFLNLQFSSNSATNPFYKQEVNSVYKKGVDAFGWNTVRNAFLGTISNFHNAEVACEDWRFNYFWAITKNLPESTLEEQFPTLKKLGDELTKIKRNALVYKNRMLEMLIVHDSITFTYPLIHLENDGIKLSDYNNPNETVVWKNTPSRAADFIKETLDYHLSETFIYSPTPDLKEKFSKSPHGLVGIVKGTILSGTRVIGSHGIIDYDNTKLTSV